MAKTAAGVGMPGVIAAARGRYCRRILELEHQGIRAEAADALILEEARAAGGVLAPGEIINLSFWSERLGMQRAVLEALVLQVRHAEPVAFEPPAAPEPPVVDGPPDSPVVGTPAPVATRNPRFPASVDGAAPDSRERKRPT